MPNTRHIDSLMLGTTFQHRSTDTMLHNRQSAAPPARHPAFLRLQDREHEEQRRQQHHDQRQEQPRPLHDDIGLKGTRRARDAGLRIGHLTHDVRQRRREAFDRLRDRITGETTVEEALCNVGRVELLRSGSVAHPSGYGGEGALQSGHCVHVQFKCQTLRLDAQQDGVKGCGRKGSFIRRARGVGGRPDPDGRLENVRDIFRINVEN